MLSGTRGLKLLARSELPELCTLSTAPRDPTTAWVTRSYRILAALFDSSPATRKVLSQMDVRRA